MLNSLKYRAPKLKVIIAMLKISKYSALRYIYILRNVTPIYIKKQAIMLNATMLDLIKEFYKDIS